MRCFLILRCFLKYIDIETFTYEIHLINLMPNIGMILSYYFYYYSRLCSTLTIRDNGNDQNPTVGIGMGSPSHWDHVHVQWTIFIIISQRELAVIICSMKELLPGPTWNLKNTVQLLVKWYINSFMKVSGLAVFCLLCLWNITFQSDFVFLD